MSAPAFLTTDPNAITTDLIAAFESVSGRSLYPAQVERLMIDLLAYRETLVRQDVQFVAEQNLVAYATGTNLDLLAQLVGVTRLVGSSATCTVRFSLGSVRGVDTTIPSGTRVTNASGALNFATTAVATIPVGQLFIDATAQAATAGSAGNGFQAATLTTMVDLISGVTASNTTISAGGVDTESDDDLRARVVLAPAAFSTAGSAAAYKFWALSTGPWVADAYVTSPAGGQVQVSVLTTAGVPTLSQLAAVTAKLSGTTVRPVTDTVTVVAANPLAFSIVADLTILSGYDPATVIAAATAAAQALVAKRSATLGLDVTQDQVRAALFVPGVYSIALSQPATNVTAGPGDFCSCTGITVTNVGGAVSG